MDHGRLTKLTTMAIPQLDVLVNNAGAQRPWKTPITEHNDREDRSGSTGCISADLDLRS
jgi:short-subunit dehydrogenase involved in D-alanine esterification of teichoic acids